MRNADINKIDKLYFGYEDIARALGISLDSARVSASRYAKQGILIRTKRNTYMLGETWNRLDRVKQFQIANLLQVPSYISLMSAMGYHEVTTQIQQDYTESIALKRTKTIEIEDRVFNYTRIQPKLYTGFVKNDEFFIATPEKALFDAVYLVSLGRYSFDVASIDFAKFDAAELNRILDMNPDRTRLMFKRLPQISAMNKPAFGKL